MYIFSEISIYQRYFDRTKCMYFVIKHFFHKYIKIWGNVSTTVITSKLMYHKNI